MIQKKRTEAIYTDNIHFYSVRKTRYCEYTVCVFKGVKKGWEHTWGRLYGSLGRGIKTEYDTRAAAEAAMLAAGWEKI